MKTAVRTIADIDRELALIADSAADAFNRVQPDREAILRRRLDTLLDERNAAKERQ